MLQGELFWFGGFGGVLFVFLGSLSGTEQNITSALCRSEANAKKKTHQDRAAIKTEGIGACGKSFGITQVGEFVLDSRFKL